MEETEQKIVINSSADKFFLNRCSVGCFVARWMSGCVARLLARSVRSRRRRRRRCHCRSRQQRRPSPQNLGSLRRSTVEKSFAPRRLVARCRAISEQQRRTTNRGTERASEQQVACRPRTGQTHRCRKIQGKQRSPVARKR